jgi:hypothetical protein
MKYDATELLREADTSLDRDLLKHEPSIRKQRPSLRGQRHIRRLTNAESL